VQEQCVAGQQAGRIIPGGSTTAKVYKFLVVGMAHPAVGRNGTSLYNSICQGGGGGGWGQGLATGWATLGPASEGKVVQFHVAEKQQETSSGVR